MHTSHHILSPREQRKVDLRFAWGYYYKPRTPLEWLHRAYVKRPLTWLLTLV